MEQQIDLGRYRTEGSRVYAGRPRGEYARKAEDLDRTDSMDNVSIVVRIPEDTLSVNSSFFLGLFGDSIKHLGEDRFRERFHFTGRPLGRVYESAIREAVTTASPFSSAVR